MISDRFPKISTYMAYSSAAVAYTAGVETKKKHEVDVFLAQATGSLRLSSNVRGKQVILCANPPEFLGRWRS